MADEQPNYRPFVMYVAQNALGGVQDTDSVDVLVSKLKGVIDSPDPVIEADRDDSDYEHMWSAAATDRFNKRHLIGLVVQLAEGLKDLDIYSREAIQLIYSITEPETSRFSFVHCGDYNNNRRRVRDLGIEYLLEHAPTAEQRKLIEEFKEE